MVRYYVVCGRLDSNRFSILVLSRYHECHKHSLFACMSADVHQTNHEGSIPRQLLSMNRVQHVASAHATRIIVNVQNPSSFDNHDGSPSPSTMRQGPLQI